MRSSVASPMEGTTIADTSESLEQEEGAAGPSGGRMHRRKVFQEGGAFLYGEIIAIRRS